MNNGFEKGKERKLKCFFRLIMEQMIHKPNDKGKIPGRADTVRLVEVAF